MKEYWWNPGLKMMTQERTFYAGVCAGRVYWEMEKDEPVISGHFPASIEGELLRMAAVKGYKRMYWIPEPNGEFSARFEKREWTNS